LALDVGEGETAGQAYRLYQAAFARTPDLPGVAYHMNDMENNGLSITQIASNFIASPEFKTKYGDNPTEEQYINLLYQNVLNRTPAEFEVEYYKDRFQEGSTDWNTTLVFFAESPENILRSCPRDFTGDLVGPVKLILLGYDLNSSNNFIQENKVSWFCSRKKHLRNQCRTVLYSAEPISSRVFLVYKFCLKAIKSKKQTFTFRTL
jgi:hypothetical protein